MTGFSLRQKKLVRGLSRKKVRRETGLFLIEGDKMVREVLKGVPAEGISCEPVLVAATGEWMAAYGDIIPAGTDRCVLSDSELGEVSSLRRPNEALVVAVQPKYEKVREEILGGLSLALETVQDPGNLGTIIRTADWFGIRNIICSKDSAELFNPKVIQSTMGSFLRVKVHYTDLGQFLEELTSAEPDFPVWAGSAEGESIYSIPAPEKGMVMLGNESRGLSGELMKKAGRRVSIPPWSDRSRPESLNVASAAAIICAHFRNGPGYSK